MGRHLPPIAGSRSSSVLALLSGDRSSGRSHVEPRDRPEETRHSDDWASAGELAAAVAQLGDRVGQHLPLERQAALFELGAEIRCARQHLIENP